MEEDKSEVDPKYILDLPLAYPSLKFHSNYQLDSQLIWLEFEPYTSSVKNSGILFFYGLMNIFNIILQFSSIIFYFIFTVITAG